MLNNGVNDATRLGPYYSLLMDTMGKRIRGLRTAKGWTLEQLATLVGTTKGAIAQWEGDLTPNIRPQNLLKLCEELGTDPWYIVFGPDRRAPDPGSQRRRGV